MAWIRRNPDSALRPVEEDASLDPSRPEATYEFVHALDALTLRVLAGSTQSSDTGLALFHDALTSLKDRMDADGGFFGFRTFSWSTSQVLSSLHEAHGRSMTEFPRRQPEVTVSGSNALLQQVLAIVVIAVVIAGPALLAALIGGVALAIPFAIFLIVFMAFALVVIGRLTGRGFTDLATTAIGRLGPRQDA